MMAPSAMQTRDIIENGAVIDIGPGLQRARLRHPDIAPGGSKLIGWGAGYQFEKFYPRLGLALAYTACVYEIETGKLNDGDTLCGVPVHHAERLREEDPNHVLIVIFSGKWFDCMRQIPTYGRFRMIRAIDEYTGADSLEQRLLRFFGSAPERAPAVPVGMVVQGPVMADITARVLAANRRKFPFATLVLSTWDDTPAALLAACAPHVDDIVLSPVPAQAGAFNTVMQRDSARAGLAALAARGVAYAFKTRTDQSITGPVDLDQLLAQARRPLGGADTGKRERIVFSPQVSWRFVPFHLTDQLQFGRVADLLEFWQCRDDSILGAVSIDSNAPASHLSLCTPEAIFVRCYLRRIGVDYELTLASYWRVCAERFAAIPGDDISLLNWKAIALFDLPLEPDVRAAGMRDSASLLSTWQPDQWPLDAGAASDQLANAVDGLGLTVWDYIKATPFDLPAIGST